MQEHLSLKYNDLEKLFGELTELGCLRSLNLRHNKIKSSGVPAELFQLDELTTLDLSHNRLKEVPEGLERAKSLLVLNLSNNQ
jgi:Leucine-rich repeat (LRR) protein